MQDAAVREAAKRAAAGPAPVVKIAEILESGQPGLVTLHVSILDQRLRIYCAGELAVDAPVSTGRSDSPTPPGSFTVARKARVFSPQRYGSFVSSDDGDLIVAGVYPDRDPMPAGARFVPSSSVIRIELVADLPLAIHGGVAKSYPYTDGSVIVPPDVLADIFSLVQPGTPVTITSDPAAP